MNVYSLSTIFFETDKQPLRLFVHTKNTKVLIRFNYHALETLHHSSELIYDRLDLAHSKYMPAFISSNKGRKIINEDSFKVIWINKPF